MDTGEPLSHRDAGWKGSPRCLRATPGGKVRARGPAPRNQRAVLVTSTVCCLGGNGHRSGRNPLRALNQEFRCQNTRPLHVVGEIEGQNHFQPATCIATPGSLTPTGRSDSADTHRPRVDPRWEPVPSQSALGVVPVASGSEFRSGSQPRRPRPLRRSSPLRPSAWIRGRFAAECVVCLGPGLLPVRSSTRGAARSLSDSPSPCRYTEFHCVTAPVGPCVAAGGFCRGKLRIIGKPRSKGLSDISFQFDRALRSLSPSSLACSLTAHHKP